MTQRPPNLLACWRPEQHTDAKKHALDTQGSNHSNHQLCQLAAAAIKAAAVLLLLLY
jgi:hypothetical protein